MTTSSTSGGGPICGDGIVEGDEGCDDGNIDNTDECVDGCAIASCGDGFVYAGVEACDDANDDNTDTCVEGCEIAACGDGFVGPGEGCDDGNNIEVDACSNSCALASCGDGVVQAPEQCDDGDADNNDACLSTCVPASCGDGFIHAGVEACDDGNADNTDSCLVSCKPASCGDDFIHAGVEACDDGNANNSDACLDSCKLAACGDGFLQVGKEECDDGNKSGSDGCQPDCKLIYAVQVVAGIHLSCVLTNTGDVHCWGGNSSGSLGQGNTTPIGDNELPNTIGPVDFGAKGKVIAAAGLRVCVITEADTLRCWGANGNGELGYGHTNTIGDNEKPVVAGEVDVGGKVLQVALGANHTCAVVEGGNVRCWGDAQYGQTGHGDTVTIGDNELPTAAGYLSLGGKVKQVGAGLHYSCALLESGDVRCWGRSHHGQLGYGNTNTIGDNELPTSVGTVSLGAKIETIAIGRFHACVIDVNQHLRCWGHNLSGQLGLAHTQTIGDDEFPSASGTVDIGGDKALGLGLRDTGTCAVVAPDKVRCWGNGNAGQNGLANTLDIGEMESPSAVGYVDVGDPIKELQANYSHTCARTLKGAIRCWGQAANSALGYGNILNIGDNEVPAVAGIVKYLY